jgi:hypothetical protein
MTSATLTAAATGGSQPRVRPAAPPPRSQPGQGGEHLAAVLGQDDLALGGGQRHRLVAERGAVQHPGPARDHAAAAHRPAAIEHGGPDIGQRGLDVAPARTVQAGVDVLDHVLGGGQVPDQEEGEAD